MQVVCTAPAREAAPIPTAPSSRQPSRRTRDGRRRFYTVLAHRIAAMALRRRQVSRWTRKGNLYGTTSYGGAYNYYGTVFKLSPMNNTWTETTLHSFSGYEGFYPGGGVVIKGGRLYGTT